MYLIKANSASLVCIAYFPILQSDYLFKDQDIIVIRLGGNWSVFRADVIYLVYFVIVIVTNVSNIKVTV